MNKTKLGLVSSLFGILAILHGPFSRIFNSGPIRGLCYTPNMNMPNLPLPGVPQNWHRAHKQTLSRGDRAADKMRNGMGSWAFVLAAILFMAGWATLNTVEGIHHWDKFPFILLNLFLSMLAALQGAILLIAAKRADAISAAMAQHDYETNIRAEKEIQQLMELNRKQIEQIEDLKKLISSSKHAK